MPPADLVVGRADTEPESGSDLIERSVTQGSSAILYRR